MADAAAPQRVTRRTFIGWWMASILTSLTVAGIIPILPYLWPAPPKGQKKGALCIVLTPPLDQITEGQAVKFNAPSSPNSAFIMADGGGDNAPGDLAFGGFMGKNGGKTEAFAINCSHLGCSVALKTSRPSSSVPIRWAALGARVSCEVWVSGSYGAISGTKMATRIHAPARVIPTMASGWRHAEPGG